MNRLEIPRGCEPYLVLQRTQYRSRLRRALHRVGLGRFYDRHLVRALEPLRHETIRRSYERELAREFEALRPYLPTACDSVLDIGCGLAGIDCWIYEACGRPALYLLDREGEAEFYYGFRADAAHYNSLALARALLEANGVAAEDIETVDVGSQPLPSPREFDLVISLLSWGFHYPVDTYLDYVAAHLAPEGVLILDVRRDTGGYEQLAARFQQLEVIAETRKLQRVGASRSRAVDQRSPSFSSSSG